MGTFKLFQFLRRRRKVPICAALLTFTLFVYLRHKTTTSEEPKDEDKDRPVTPDQHLDNYTLEMGGRPDHIIVHGVGLQVKEKKLLHEDMSVSLDQLHHHGLQRLEPVVGAEITGTPGKKEEGKMNYLMLLGHYEQLGMSTVNLVNAVYVSHTIDRRIVVPFVRHARFCGIPVGWSGQIRKNSRRFMPMSTYYNVSQFNLLLRSHGGSGFVSFSEFAENCSVKTGRKLTILLFFYDDDKMKHLRLGDANLQQLRQDIRSKGWVRCDFVNKKLKLEDRFEIGVTVEKFICIDPEVVTNTSVLSNDILGKDKCAGILFWRGIGDKRTHFNVSSFLPAKSLLPLLKPSNVVIDEVKRFSSAYGLGQKKYIGVHIRSERQILWLGLARFKRCLHVLTKAVQSLQKERKIDLVFVASDAGQFGSDQLHPYLSAQDSRKVLDMINEFTTSVKGLTFAVRQKKHYLWTDTGLVALVELHLLAQSDQLVTLGAGTFQNWLIGTFRLHKAGIKSKTWSIVRACTKESRKAHTPQEGG